jgi:hypothetical protein
MSDPFGLEIEPEPLKPLLKKDLKRWSKDCVSHHYACDCREYRFKQIEEAAKDLAGAVWRLDEYGYLAAMIDSFFDDEQMQCDHWIDIARKAVDRIRVLTVIKEE